MPAEVLVVGQGLAGTLLAWELERAQIPFAIADRGSVGATTAVAAGLINPITGRRLVKSWRVDALLPLARESYRALGAALGVTLWRDVRVRRLFADAREREVFAAKRATGELAPYVDAAHADADGCWIEGAARIDLATLLAASRVRWEKQGRWREAEIDPSRAAEQHDLVIDCTGAAGARRGSFDFVPWEFSKGEALEIATDGLAADIVFNRRLAVVPLEPGRAWIGATHEPGVTDLATTPAARATLESFAREMLPASARCQVVAQRAGVRVNLPDKRPVVGRHPRHHRIGVMNALGAKGALLAPWLARIWVNHLTRATPFDAEVAVGRFSACNSSQALSR
jgi:glycine/D-amino acid oxidase-like deaminating enzyme